MCTDPNRDGRLICVVEQPGDVLALERAAAFRGRYHVLGGALSPLEGTHPDNLRIRELMLPILVLMIVFLNRFISRREELA